MMLKKIKFIKDCSVESQGEVEQSFKAGEIVQLSVPSARRWLRRNLAVEIMGVQADAPKKSVDRGGKPIVKKRTVKKRKPPITAEVGGDKEAPVTNTEASSE